MAAHVIGLTWLKHGHKIVKLALVGAVVVVALVVAVLEFSLQLLHMQCGSEVNATTASKTRDPL